MSRGLQVVVPEGFVGAVLSDLTSTRRAQVKYLSEAVDGERTVLANAPLATLLVSLPANCKNMDILPMQGYARDLRSMTSGSASFSLLPSGHIQMDRQQQNAIVEEIRGY